MQTESEKNGLMEILKNIPIPDIIKNISTQCVSSLEGAPQ